MSSSTPQILPSQRHAFDIPRDVTYVNCAYMSPLLHDVVAACDAGLRLKAQPWRLTPADFFDRTETVRSLFGQLINDDPEGVALIPSASYGLTLAMRTLEVEPGQRIVVLKDQFPSNVYPWRERAKQGAELVTVDPSTSNDPTEPVLAAIDHDTAIVALPEVLWTTGERLDLVAVGARCREVGAALVLDLTQSLGAMGYDNRAVQPDFLVVGNYKWLLGPYTTGFVWMAPRWRSAEPMEYTWLGRKGSEDFSRLIDYTDEPQPGARSHDMGQRANFGSLPGVQVALQQILDWGAENIEATLLEKTRYLSQRLAEFGFEPMAESRRAAHYLAVKAPASLPNDALQRLAAEQIYISQRGPNLRITPHLYNDEEDLDRLVDRLGALVGR